MNPIQRLRNSRILRRAAGLAMIPAAALALAPAAPAMAASAPTAVHLRISYPSVIYTQPGRPHAFASCWSSCGPYAGIYPANGDGAHMICWADSGTYDGNYTSNRWFVVNLAGWPGEWWIHSSYVYYQTSVGHC